jgi:hypothetical protein
MSDHLSLPLPLPHGQGVIFGQRPTTLTGLRDRVLHLQAIAAAHEAVALNVSSSGTSAEQVNILAQIQASVAHIRTETELLLRELALRGSNDDNGNGPRRGNSGTTSTQGNSMNQVSIDIAHPKK